MTSLYHRITSAATLFLGLHAAYAQTPLPAPVTDNGPFLVRLDEPASLQARKQPSGSSDARWLREKLSLEAQDELRPVAGPGKSTAGAGVPPGLSVAKYQQYHQGLKVEHGVYNVHSKNGQVQTISGERYQVPAELKLTATLSEAQALQRALAYVGAKVYQWQEPASASPVSTPPKGELLLCKVSRHDKTPVAGGITLAYKFDIYAVEPLSRAYIYVDAHSGQVIHQNALLKHVDGSAQTRYSGTRTISTSKSGATYRLRDEVRGVETYNMAEKTNYAEAVDFTDNDNNWTAAEYDNAAKDNAALDAHWGTIQTYDYFKNVHGRNSIDGNGAKLKSYIHFDKGYINASWNGSVLTYGDGGAVSETQVVQPLTSLDVVAHEIGHGFCQYTAGLEYENESGALNEALSDIWGATVEYTNAPTKSTWLLGEDFGYIIRSMSDPNQRKHPDTYQGQYWFTGMGDNGGVHTNSGVLNHWYYLLVTGKSGVNDHGDSYQVTGIGMAKAAQIVYRAETEYLTPNSTYYDARRFFTQAAIDLFGAGSVEARQTANAWFAVGVNDPATAPTNLRAMTSSDTQINLTWQDNSTTETNYRVERATGSPTNFSAVATLGANAGSYQDKNLPTNAIYYYRVRAAKITQGAVTGGGAYSNEAYATVGFPAVSLFDGRLTTCGITLLDPGGGGRL